MRQVRSQHRSWNESSFRVRFVFTSLSSCINKKEKRDLHGRRCQSKARPTGWMRWLNWQRSVCRRRCFVGACCSLQLHCVKHCRAMARQQRRTFMSLAFEPLHDENDKWIVFIYRLPSSLHSDATYTITTSILEESFSRIRFVSTSLSSCKNKKEKRDLHGWRCQSKARPTG